MSRLFQAATAVAVALSTATAIFVGVPGMAQDRPGDVVFEPAAPVQPAATAPLAPVDASPSDSDAPVIADDRDSSVARVSSLQQAMAIADRSASDDRDHHCLAVGIYYESQGEPLEGQLAVAHVIINRAQSGRFAGTVCGVLTQRGQFSFVRGGVLPTPPQNRNWRTAQAIASVALDNGWRNPAPGAMYFHASHVSPRWNRARVARLGNHIFYR